MMKMWRSGTLILLGLVLAVTTAKAGVLYLYEIGSPDGGLAAGQVSGTYESTAIHFVALNAEWRF